MKNDKSKSTILVISMGFLCLHLAFVWEWALNVSFIIGVIGILSSYLSLKIELAWMKLAQILGYIVPNILLSVVFFLLLTPLAILFRLFNKDVLMLSNSQDSYFIDIEREIQKNDFEKVY
jgi:hypothetical protein